MAVILVRHDQYVMDKCCWNVLYKFFDPEYICLDPGFGHNKYIYIWSGRYYENLIWCGDTVSILKSDIFHCSDSFERGNQFNSILTEQIYNI